MGARRTQSEASIYHVIARGTGRQIIFEDDEDRKRFLYLFKKALKDCGAEVYAWCLMSNHVHLLIHASIDVLSKVMHSVLRPYAIYFNERNGRVGHLFQERFRSEPINDDVYFLTVIRYIHRNPVKAGIAKLEEYPWSSYHEYTGRPWICSIDFPLGAFGSVEEFERFHAIEADDTCLDVHLKRTKTRGMSDDFALEIARDVLGATKPEELKTLDTPLRNREIVKLKKAGLTILQIERLTGIGRGSVQRACKGVLKDRVV